MEPEDLRPNVCAVMRDSPDLSLEATAKLAEATESAETAAPRLAGRPDFDLVALAKWGCFRIVEAHLFVGGASDLSEAQARALFRAGLAQKRSSLLRWLTERNRAAVAPLICVKLVEAAEQSDDAMFVALLPRVSASRAVSEFETCATFASKFYPTPANFADPRPSALRPVPRAVGGAHRQHLLGDAEERRDRAASGAGGHRLGALHDGRAQDRSRGHAGFAREAAEHRESGLRGELRR
jgi:hypothetical protein